MRRHDRSARHLTQHASGPSTVAAAVVRPAFAGRPARKRARIARISAACRQLIANSDVFQAFKEKTAAQARQQPQQLTQRNRHSTRAAPEE